MTLFRGCILFEEIVSISCLKKAEWHQNRICDEHTFPIEDLQAFPHLCVPLYNVKQDKAQFTQPPFSEFKDLPRVGEIQVLVSPKWMGIEFAGEL